MDFKLTPTETFLYKILEDGEPHAPKDLLAAFNDPTVDKRQLQFHVFNIKEKIEVSGETIVAQAFGRRVAYRLVQLIRRSSVPPVSS